MVEGVTACRCVSCGRPRKAMPVLYPVWKLSLGVMSTLDSHKPYYQKSLSFRRLNTNYRLSPDTMICIPKQLYQGICAVSHEILRGTNYCYREYETTEF